MTTNSPNPVDGDVQALIADCQTEIEDLKRSIDRCDAIGTSDYLHHLQSKLKRQYAALASLTADTVAVLDIQKSRAEGKFALVYTRVGHALPDGTYSLSTTPPAQLLRTVELPEPYDDGHGNLWLPQDAVISAVKNAGCEVKND